MSYAQLKLLQKFVWRCFQSPKVQVTGIERDHDHQQEAEWHFRGWHITMLNQLQQALLLLCFILVVADLE
jgi:hypothetical protein